ncbi:MAG: cell division protein FtsZ [Cyclobacteriaceae bacterium]|nr:cell division protein FtsZ [Cyclobacteriaceae bacterium]MCB0498171.1 cell division protein FtsZ [Cyclobacteriaceae bacterium]MCB9238895.1 cell division protein FtsZ [Flammeovirgaceae bacterium]MCO5270614.1 cell division protein FtsZ [Cyclobacteriaceae bacterium]MCW5900945.1 cell division protein FtsZ [Cyclobacteriaceae bacterium]
MSGIAYKFELPKHHQSIIKVIGVGGGGSNAVNHMFGQGIKDVEFVVCNTDVQALNSSPVPYKLQIGANLTEGLGCGANPEVGRAAAVESKDQIREMLAGTKMVFVTAGMGGGTGTGAAPVLAKIAKDMDILTVGIVTVPFLFEGKKKLAQAQIGIEALRASCDTVLVILNDKLREIYGNLSIGQAFAQADNVLTTAAKGIAEIITLAGYVNVDFQDVRTVMHNAGGAVMGSAETRGENRAKLAAQQSLASPLLDNKDIMGAKRILLSIISGEEAELQMDELSEITEYIQEQAGDEAEVIFGHGVDPTIGDRIRVTVIATDFEAEAVSAKETAQKKVMDLDRTQSNLFEQMDNSVNNNDDEVGLKPVDKSRPLTTTKGKQKEEKKDDEERKEEGTEERGYTFTLFEKKEGPIRNKTLFDKVEGEEEGEEGEEGEDGLFGGDDEGFDQGNEISSDQVLNEEGMMEYRKTKERLQQQARERRERLKAAKKHEMTKEEFNEKWSLPAYLRRGVKMGNVPHSSEPYISRYNLNDENSILGNNKFLHDNVD